jgi:hypothetical protein
VSAATLVSDICVGAAVTIAEGRLETQQRIDMLLTNWTVALSNTCLALAIAAVVAVWLPTDRPVPSGALASDGLASRQHDAAGG